MATYVYECPAHGRVEVVKAHAEAGHPEVCGRCAAALGLVNAGLTPAQKLCFQLAPMRKVFTAQSFIMRPDGYNLRPGDDGYSDFRRELETGQVRNVGSRERYAETVRDDYVPEQVKVVYTEEQRYELAQLSQVVDRQIREEMPDLESA